MPAVHFQTNRYKQDAATGAKQAMDRLTSEATAFARANRFTEASNLYVPGKRKGTTPEQAVASALENNPEIYGQYRARHNAKALIAQLQGAGVSVQFAGE
jgi:hypothetical protein